MASPKTVETKASVNKYITSLPDASKRKDCRAIAKLMRSATGKVPRMWGDRIIGFGKHHYQYANGKPGEICNVGFAPRARSFAFYMSNFEGREVLLAKLGKYKFSGGCLHINKLDDVDAEVFGTIIKQAYRKGEQ